MTKGSGNVALFNQDSNGNSLSFYVTRVESRQQIMMLIQERGGEMLEQLVPAIQGQTIVCVVGDKLEFHLTLPEGMIVVTKGFIFDSIEQNKLCKFEDYAPSQGEQIEIAAPQGRNAYTETEDTALLDAVKEATEMGYSREGMKLYKLVAPQFPRHTAQSLRDRYLKTLLPVQQSRFSNVSTIKDRIEKHARSDPVVVSQRSTEKHIKEPRTDIHDFQPATQAPEDYNASPFLVVNESLGTLLAESPKKDSTLPSSPTSLSESQNEDENEAHAIRQTVKWISESTNCSFEVVVYALYQCNGDVKTAIKFINSPSECIKWQCDEDLALMDKNMETIDSIIQKHGVDETRKRQMFLKSVCS